MEFGRRLPPEQRSSPAAVHKNCVQCYGTGHVRERGNRFRCKVCGGAGRIIVAPEPEPETGTAA